YDGTRGGTKCIVLKKEVSSWGVEFLGSGSIVLIKLPTGELLRLNLSKLRRTIKWGGRYAGACSTPASQGNAADGRVEQLNDVTNRQLLPRASQGTLELQQAGGFSRHNHVRVQCDDVARFPVAELRRGIRLHQIVDSRGATADCAFRDFQQFELWDSS